LVEGSALDRSRGEASDDAALEEQDEDDDRDGDDDRGAAIGAVGLLERWWRR
jgi:hypothetical protein